MLEAVESPAELMWPSWLQPVPALGSPSWGDALGSYSWECCGRLLRNRIAVQALVLLRLGCTTLAFFQSWLSRQTVHMTMDHWSQISDWGQDLPGSSCNKLGYIILFCSINSIPTFVLVFLLVWKRDCSSCSELCRHCEVHQQL